jgi:hypothetical protein
MKSPFAQRLATTPPPLTPLKAKIARARFGWEYLHAAVNNPVFLDALQAATERAPLVVVDKDYYENERRARDEAEAEDGERFDGDFETLNH